MYDDAFKKIADSVRWKLPAGESEESKHMRLKKKERRKKDWFSFLCGLFYFVICCVFSDERRSEKIGDIWLDGLSREGA